MNITEVNHRRFEANFACSNFFGVLHNVCFSFEISVLSSKYLPQMSTYCKAAFYIEAAAQVKQRIQEKNPTHACFGEGPQAILLNDAISWLNRGP